MTQRRVPLAILDEIECLARVKASLPTPKEIAARGNCAVDQVYYHLRKAYLREKRIAESLKRLDNVSVSRGANGQ